MSKLEDEAAEFKRRKAAERKRRERRGERVINVVVHVSSLAQMLFLEGLLKESQLEDLAAIEQAAAQHFRNHQRKGRVLPDKAPRTFWGRYDMSDWIEENDPVAKAGAQADKERREAEDRKRLAHLEETGDLPNDYCGYTSVPDYIGQRGRGIPRQRNRGYIDGLTIHNNRGVKIGRAMVGTSVPGQSAKRIKQLKDARVRAEEKKIEKKHGRLVAKDKGVHTFNMTEVEHNALIFNRYTDEE
jgi:hypothetical protein